MLLRTTRILHGIIVLLYPCATLPPESSSVLKEFEGRLVFPLLVSSSHGLLVFPQKIEVLGIVLKGKSKNRKPCNRYHGFIMGGSGDRWCGKIFGNPINPKSHGLSCFIMVGHGLSACSQHRNGHNLRHTLPGYSSPCSAPGCEVIHEDPIYFLYPEILQDISRISVWYKIDGSLWYQISSRYFMLYLEKWMVLSLWFSGSIWNVKRASSWLPLSRPGKIWKSCLDRLPICWDRSTHLLGWELKNALKLLRQPPKISNVVGLKFPTYPQYYHIVSQNTRFLHNFMAKSLKYPNKQKTVFF